ncbi:uncharacterized protein LOC114036404 [Vombatus ursinus]|uniref:uncharacterized protein LOC114036404 n=1 Tax=Vombatus ursinus TaxID=29139 RepID=UPI000FFDAE0B|nr:uncharacterized protein LOC114036404 [Vombatus ursinus]
MEADEITEQEEGLVLGAVGPRRLSGRFRPRGGLGWPPGRQTLYRPTPQLARGIPPPCLPSPGEGIRRRPKRNPPRGARSGSGNRTGQLAPEQGPPSPPSEIVVPSGYLRKTQDCAPTNRRRRRHRQKRRRRKNRTEKKRRMDKLMLLLGLLGSLQGIWCGDPSLTQHRKLRCTSWMDSPDPTFLPPYHTCCITPPCRRNSTCGRPPLLSERSST